MNAQQSTKITLVGELIASPGTKFVYMGETNKCTDCRLRGACLKLEVGKIYSIIDVRDVRHPCNGVFAGKVRTVEVLESPFKIAIQEKIVVEGATISYKSIDCDESANCPHRRLCNPFWIEDGNKLKIISILGERINCQQGKQYQLVEVIRQD